MKSAARKEVLALILLLAILVFLIPVTPAEAIVPFGGPILRILSIGECKNGVIYTLIGPPRGGPYIWGPGTKTYLYGPPRSTGQYELGTALPPSFCVISFVPFIAVPGLSMILLGTSATGIPLSELGGLSPEGALNAI